MKQNLFCHFKIVNLLGDTIRESTNVDFPFIMKDFKKNLEKVLPNARKGYIKCSYNFEIFLARHNKHLRSKTLPKDVIKFDENFPNHLPKIMTKALTVNNQIMARIRDAEKGIGITLTREEGISLLAVSFLCGFDRVVHDDEGDVNDTNLEGLLCLTDDKMRHERMAAVTTAIRSDVRGSFYFEKKCTKTGECLPDGTGLTGVTIETSNLRSSGAETVLLPVDDLLVNPFSVKKQTKVGQIYQDYPELLLTHIIFRSLNPGEVIIMKGCRNFSLPLKENSKEVVFVLTRKPELLVKNSFLTVPSLEEGLSTLKNLAHSLAGLGFSKLDSSTKLRLLKLEIESDDSRNDKKFDSNANSHVQLQTLLLLAAFTCCKCNLTIHTEGNAKLVKETRDLMDAVNRNSKITKLSHWVVQMLSKIKRAKGNEYSRNLFTILSAIKRTQNARPK